MKEKQILVIRKEPGKSAEVEPLFENTLEAFQTAVGGYIETVTVAQDLCIVCNETGRIDVLPYNCNVLGYDFYGPILAVGVREDEFSSIRAPHFPTVLRMLSGRGELRDDD